MLTALRHLTLRACAIEDFGPLPGNLVFLHVHTSLQSYSCSVTWTRSVLARLKEVSLSYHNNHVQMFLPIGQRYLMQSIDVAVLSQALAPASNIIMTHDGGSLGPLEQAPQLETLIIRNVSCYAGNRLPPINKNEHLSSIFRNNGQQLITLDLSYSLISASLLRDIVMFCPALTTVTLEGADNLLAVTIEEFVQGMSDRLRRLCVYDALCYEKSTCFSNAVKARSTLMDLCLSFDIELEIGGIREWAPS